MSRTLLSLVALALISDASRGEESNLKLLVGEDVVMLFHVNKATLEAFAKTYHLGSPDEWATYKTTSHPHYPIPDDLNKLAKREKGWNGPVDIADYRVSQTKTGKQFTGVLYSPERQILILYLGDR